MRPSAIRTQNFGIGLISNAFFVALSLACAAVAFECRAQPAAATPPMADAGAPDESALKALGEAAIKDQLVDPYSAVIDWWPQPFAHVSGITKGGSIFKHTVVAGDALVGCGLVNAKNRMGGYVGRVAFDVAIQNGQVVLAEMDDADADSVPLAANFCHSLGFGAAAPLPPPPREPAARVVFGAAFTDVGPAIANMLARPDLKGAVVFAVAPTSVASRGGLVEGDIITGFGGQPISGKLDLLNAIHAVAPGALIKVDLLRAGKTLSLPFQF